MSPKKIDYDRVEELYDPTLSDDANAERIGISQASVNAWRRAKGYKPRKQIKHEEFDKLYSIGCTDREIALTLNVTPMTIYWHRKRNGIPTNHPILRLERLEKEVLPNLSDSEKPWKDPESMFCDAKFLEQFKKGKFEEEPL